jgi:acylphosphatase
MMKTVSIIVTGKVQGVWYRQSAKEKATELGIIGFVQNLPDGTVTITATGSAHQLEAFIAWCRQGPTRACVEKLDIQELSLQRFDNFSIIR